MQISELRQIKLFMHLNVETGIEMICFRIPDLSFMDKFEEEEYLEQN